ncbi:hypothetical protein H5410_035901 [Solanum commersonii]|uniref:Uncharacterized protein n=1 Tax=Solanum commersonii TaxID=4109 RepID=A0A9J5Y375_SOLCO|nr:hypothetical protein H5410_035901 [Solanum commersonii]
MVKEGKHIKARYFSYVCIDKDSLAREFPQILRQIRELHMEFIFVELRNYNLHMVREFYAHWARREISFCDCTGSRRAYHSQEHTPTPPGHSIYTVWFLVHSAIDQVQREEISLISSLCSHA